MNTRWVCACMVCALLLAESVASAEDIDPSLRDRFLKAVRQTVWNSEQVSFRARCVSTVDYTNNSESVRAKLRENKIDPDKPEIEILNCAIRGPLALRTGTNRGIEYVRAKNSEYAFQVSRASVAKAYSLSFIEQLGRASALDRRIQEAESEARGFPFGGWYMMDETVAGVVASPTFQMKRVAKENRDGADLVRIEFDRKYPDPKKRAFSYTNGFMVCDPERHWALVEWGRTSHNGLITSRSSLTYGNLIDGLPIPQKITHLMLNEEDKREPINWRQVIDIEVIGDDVPREEFYLSHYGLPEPKFQRGWLGTWMWYLIAGIVCLGMATIIVKRRSAGEA